LAALLVQLQHLGVMLLLAEAWGAAAVQVAAVAQGVRQHFRQQQQQQQHNRNLQQQVCKSPLASSSSSRVRFSVGWAELAKCWTPLRKK
jgi:hypothetical protein